MLGVPQEGDRSAERLVRKVRLLAARTLLGLPRARVSPELAEALGPVQASLTELLRARPKAVLESLGSPDVLPLLLCMHSGVLPPERCVRAALPSLLVSLARRPDCLAEALPWPVPVQGLVDPELGRLVSGEPLASGLVASDGKVLLGEAGVPGVELRSCVGVKGLRPLSIPGAQLASFDTNPLAHVEAHPDKEGNALDLGGRSPAAWAEALDQALRLVRAGLPTLHAELRWTLDRVVPVGYEAERHLSASYREAPGTVYLSLHPSSLVLAEALIHETQHGKLNLLSWLDAVLLNGDSTWTESPVRPDLRPLRGVLLAVHAFVPVAQLHRALEAAGDPICGTELFERRRREVLESNARGLEVLEELARPTEVGARILTSLQGVHQDLVV